MTRLDEIQDRYAQIDIEKQVLKIAIKKLELEEHELILECKKEADARIKALAAAGTKTALEEMRGGKND